MFGVQPSPAVNSVSPRHAHEAVSRGALLVDVRDDAEKLALSPFAAVSVCDEQAALVALLEDPDREVIVICASGERSLRACERLIRGGGRSVFNLEGGVNAWHRDGLPVTRGDGPEYSERYRRQVLLPGFGAHGQRALLASSVLVVGAGGLGSPVIQYLSGAGVGCIGVVDHDHVELSNLHRQPIHASAEIGVSKASSAGYMAALNEDINVVVFDEPLSAESSARIGAARAWDVIVDCVDSPPARREIARLAVSLEAPLITGAVGAWDGQVGVFAPHITGACAACWNPTGGASVLAGTCRNNGVLGTAPALIGIMLATEVLKLVAKLGSSSIGTTIVVDVLGGQTDRFVAHQRDGCEVCARVVRGGSTRSVARDDSGHPSLAVT